MKPHNEFCFVLTPSVRSPVVQLGCSGIQSGRISQPSEHANGLVHTHLHGYVEFCEYLVILCDNCVLKVIRSEH
jgi:hypothetical protein